MTRDRREVLERQIYNVFAETWREIRRRLGLRQRRPRMLDVERPLVVLRATHAYRHGMAWEFWAAYRQYRRAGYTASEASWWALVEWDL